jgi:hypothetical protein
MLLEAYLLFHFKRNKVVLDHVPGLATGAISESRARRK